MRKSSIQVRRAQAGDAAALVDLRGEMFEAMGTSGGDSAWRINAFDWFVARVDDSAFGIFVVDDGGEVVACAMGSIRDAAPSPNAPDGRDVLISNVVTRADFRGRGHGRMAYEAAMSWARATGVVRAELMATPDGRGLYEREGFEVTAFPAMRAMLHRNTRSC